MPNLNFDREIFDEFTESYEKHRFKHSKYWDEYVNLIIKEIKKNKLQDFGRNRDLTKGFGDALGVTKRPKIRKLLLFPFFYKPVEKFLTKRKQLKNQKNVFNSSSNFFSNDFIKKLANELDKTVSDLGIDRFNEVDNKKLPWRYLQAAAYIELLERIINKNIKDSSLSKILNGNTIDIGGGYGPTIDTINIFKNLNGIGAGSTDYILEQYPVSFIANQYLTYRNKQILSPILSKNHKNVTLNDTFSQLRVIQSGFVTDLESLNIKFFFNSNSFQEMDESHIYEYREFIKRNKSTESYLSFFHYQDSVGKNKNEQLWLDNGQHGYINLFKNEFNLIEVVDFELHGYVSGKLYFFKL